MDNRINSQQADDNQVDVTQAQSNSVSTARRVVTAILVLVAGLLLAYVIYDTAIRDETSTSVSNPVVSIEPETEKPMSEEERLRIMQSMNQTDTDEVDIAERRAILSQMNQQEDTVTAEERAAIMEVMQ